MNRQMFKYVTECMFSMEVSDRTRSRWLSALSFVEVSSAAIVEVFPQVDTLTGACVGPLLPTLQEISSFNAL
jgi:hypothetical protein